MKTKELIERLQSLDQELDVYIWNEKESALFSVEDINETSDFGENEKGENEWDDFVTIFPANNSQTLFTLTAEEVDLLNDVLVHMTKDKVLIFYDESKVLIDNLLTRMKQYQDEHNK